MDDSKVIEILSETTINPIQSLIDSDTISDETRDELRQILINLCDRMAHVKN